MGGSHIQACIWPNAHTNYKYLYTDIQRFCGSVCSPTDRTAPCFTYSPSQNYNTGPSLSDSYTQIISQFLLLHSQPHAEFAWVIPDRYRKKEHGQNPAPKPLLGHPHCHSQGQERINRRCFTKQGREEEYGMSITFQPHFVASSPPPQFACILSPTL